MVAGGINLLAVSTDCGDTWSNIGPRQQGDTWVAAYDVACQNGMMIASDLRDGILRSSDYGTTWSIPAGLSFDRAYSVLSRNGNIYAGTGNNGVFRSSDDGLHWEPSSGGLPVEQYRLGGTGIASVYQIAGTDTAMFSATQYGVYRSLDDGKTWVATSLKAQTQTVYASGKTIIAAANAANAFAFRTGAFTGALYRSTDNGISWQQGTVVELLDPHYFHVKRIYSYKGVFFAMLSNNGVYMSSDSGRIWRAFNDGLPLLKDWETGGPCWPTVIGMTVSCGELFLMTADWMTFERKLYHRSLASLEAPTSIQSGDAPSSADPKPLPTDADGLKEIPQLRVRQQR